MSGTGRRAVEDDENVPSGASTLSPHEMSEETSLHEIRVANAVSIGPGNYRLPLPKAPLFASLAVNPVLRSPRRDASSTKLHEAELPSLSVEQKIEVDGYEKDANTGDYDYASGDVLSPFLGTESRGVISGAALRILQEENEYLEEQLDATFLRIKELETLLSERNRYMENLESENGRLSADCQNLKEALGKELENFRKCF
uniref:HAP1 N-terminal domain-containing protein n=2 Tax=Angiostrongylus cantonensis TaxID=6313 RepID=A0A0K0DQ97_ANGCA